MSWFPILTQLLMLNPHFSLQDQLGGKPGSWRERQAAPGAVYRLQWPRCEFKSYPLGTLVSYVDVVQFLVKCC